MSTKVSESKSEHAQSTLGTDQLVGDFRALMADAEALISATASHHDGAIESVRNKAVESLASAKEALAAAQGPLTEKVKVVAEGADEFVHRNPWEAVGVAAGLGLLVGLFVGRR